MSGYLAELALSSHLVVLCGEFAQLTDELVVVGNHDQLKILALSAAGDEAG